MGIAKHIVIIDNKAGDVEFAVDGLIIPGVIEYTVEQKLEGLPRVTFTIAVADKVDVVIKART